MEGEYSQVTGGGMAKIAVKVNEMFTYYGRVSMF